MTVTGSSGFEASHLTAGDLHSCVSTRLGLVVCWGDNSHAQLGRDRGAVVDDKDAIPTPVPTLAGVTAVAAGANHLGLKHACSRMGGAIACTGSTERGQVGSKGANGVLYDFGGD
jgi:hypothetical protein